MLAYGICFVMGLCFVGLGIYSLKAKKAMPFWAGVPMEKVEDVKGYNRAVGRLWIVYGIVFNILCIPLMSGNALAVAFSIIGMAFEAIAAMGIYGTVIGPKYQKNQEGRKQ